MEKRWCERIPVSISVELIYHGNRIGKCKVKDISLRGICLNSGPLAFSGDTEIMIKFPDARYLSGNIDHINGIVVRNCPGETSLVFDPAIPEMIGSIIRCARNDIRKYPAATMRFAAD